MNRFLTTTGLALALVLSVLRTAAQDDEYFRIYSVIQEADTLRASQPGDALAKYTEAQSQLQRLQKTYPEWNSNVVGFRLNAVSAAVAELKASAATRVGTNLNSTNRTANSGSAQPAPEELQSQISSLQATVRQLQDERSLLESKLKEALAAQPAAMDPRELAKAEQEVKSLAKENELLKVRLEAKEKEPAAADSKSIDQLKKDLADLQQKLAEQTSKAAALTLERDALQGRLNATKSDTDTLAALRAENETLKRQAASPRPAPQSTPDNGSRQLTEARTQVAALQSEKETWRLEKVALENRVKQLSAAPAVSASAPVTSADSARLKQVERERDELRKKLEASEKELYGRNARSVAGRVEELTGQIEVLRTRLSVLDAQRVPYTPEELALLEKPSPPLAEARAGRKPINELPAGSAALVAEAQKDFAARRFSEAEQKYLQVLSRNEKNVATLANLAAIQLEMNHLEDAEKNIRKAIQVAPEDAYSLSLLGSLQLRQQKFDEALATLSQAAKLDPRNAEIQNYLGLVLSQKGMHSAAETALRKAIDINPDYASAHYNLAVVYLTQKPAAVELARFHYKKALASGMSRNGEVERMLEQNGPAKATPDSP